MIGRDWLAGPAMPSQVDRDYTLGPWEPIMEIPVRAPASPRDLFHTAGVNPLGASEG
jgi:hypothetical protein